MVIIRPCMHAGGQPKLATRPTGRTPRPERSPARTYTRPRPHETYLLAYLIPHTPGGPWPVLYQRIKCHNLFACNLPAHHRNPPPTPPPGGGGNEGGDRTSVPRLGGLHPTGGGRCTFRARDRAQPYWGGGAAWTAVRTARLVTRCAAGRTPWAHKPMGVVWCQPRNPRPRNTVFV